MILRHRLYVAATVLVTVLALSGVLLIHFVEASEINQVDQQLGSASPVLTIFGNGVAVHVASIAASRKTPLFANSGNSGNLGYSGNSGNSVRSLISGSPGGTPIVIPPKQIAVTETAGHIKLVSNFYVAALVNGRRLVVAQPLDVANQSPATPTITSAPVATNFQFVTVGSSAGSSQWRAVLIRLPGPNNKELLALSLNQVDATITRLRFAVIMAGLIAFVVLAAAAFWVGRLGLRPIAAVTEVADGIAAGDRSRRVSGIRPRTEAGHLARAFNVMLDEQQAIEQRLRQFVADASHELRTPLTVIQGFTGLWRQGDLRSGEAHDDAMRRIGQESARMARLVEDLLLLARLDEGRPLELASVDLVPLIQESIADVSATHPSRTIDFEAAGEIVLQGDAVSLRQVVVNLLMNAVTHTPPTATVAVRATEDSGQVVIEVADSGPGMDPKGVSHAFDRFWRADSSRTHSGSGLGLPIVAGIVTAHGGEVHLVSDTETGTVVTITLGSAPPSSQFEF